MSYREVVESLKPFPGVTLCVVSKGRDEREILPLLERGQRHFGENRVQELSRKWSSLKKHYPDVILHFIGRLQRNKCEEVVDLCDVIHTVDRKELALSLKTACLKKKKNPTFLIQYNGAKEPQKGGIDALAFQDLLEYCEEIGLMVQGLMCIPPKEGEPTPYFNELALMSSQQKLPIKSFGMSGDYLKAISCGSTLVRVGTKCFE
jgi:pyridoxal phosphate enzyme (YggS family)